MPSSAPNMPPNYMPPSSGAQAFQMNPMGMNPQLQGQRMQAPPPASTPTQPGPRVSPFAGPSHNTPPNGGPPSQFPTPQAPNPAHIQTSNNNNSQQAQGGQAQAGQIITPQTPNFPPGVPGAHGGGGGGSATPLSPGSEVREKERVSLLLEINSSLLLEVVKLQQTHVEAAKRDEPTVSSPDGADKEKTEQEKDKGRPPSREYVECV